MKTHLIWLITCILALFVGTRIMGVKTRVVEKPIEVVKTKEVIIEKPVEVIREIPKEVEKIIERTVEVPTKIPDEYELALLFTRKVRDAQVVSRKESLAGIQSVAAVIYLSDELKKIVSESDVRTKFEITLRRAGVTIDENSRFSLFHSQEAIEQGGKLGYVYTISTDLSEQVVAFRDDGTVIKSTMSAWRKGHFGTVGFASAREDVISNAERAAESFANEWLAMNPKK